MRVGQVVVLLFSVLVSACEIRIAPATDRASAADTTRASGDMWDGWLTLSLGERSGRNSRDADGTLQRAIEELRELSRRDLDGHRTAALHSILALVEQTEAVDSDLISRIREALEPTPATAASTCACRCRVTNCGRP